LIVACCISFYSNGAYAQDLSGLFGTWKISGTGTSEDPACGASYISGEARILQRMTNETMEAYQGRMVSSITHESCDNSLEEDMQIALFVDGDRVSVTFEDRDRPPHFLILSSQKMEITFRSGGYLLWEKTVEPSNIARAAEAKENLAQNSYEEASDIYREILLSRSRGENEVESVLWQYFDEKAACEVDSMMAVTAEQSLSFYEIVNLIDPESFGATNSEMLADFDRAEYNSRTSACNKEIDEKFGMTEGE